MKKQIRTSVTPKMEKLILMGYSFEYLTLCQDPEFAHVRWSLDDLFYLESLVGKKVKLSNGSLKVIKRVSPQVLGCMVFVEGACFLVGKKDDKIFKLSFNRDVLFDSLIN
jgi:hypothetical protein